MCGNERASPCMLAVWPIRVYIILSHKFYCNNLVFDIIWKTGKYCILADTTCSCFNYEFQTFLAQTTSSTPPPLKVYTKSLITHMIAIAFK